MKIRNIEWYIDMNDIYDAIDEMPAEKAAAALGISVERYSHLTLFEQHYLAKELFCNDEDMKVALLGLPTEVEMNTDDIEEACEWLFDRFRCRTKGFKTVDESPVVNLAPMVDGVFKDGRTYRILSNDVEICIYGHDSETPRKATMQISELISETKQIGDLLLQKDEHDLYSKVIDDEDTLYSKVMDEYAKYAVELSTEHFDFDVDMKQEDIIHAYASIQDRINGDSVLVNPMWLRREGEKRYKGNCKEFLQSLSNSNNFGRIAEGEFIDFAF